MNNKLNRWLRRCLLCAALLSGGTVNAADVEVPINFDTEFLTELLKETVFEQKQGISVWGDQSGCNDLSLSNPDVVIENAEAFIIADMSARTGWDIAGYCLPFLNWQGRIKTRQEVEVIDPAGRIGFTTVETELLDSDGQPSEASNRIWELVSEVVFPRYNRFTINLVPAVNEIRDLLPLFLDAENLEQSQRVVDSFALSEVTPRQNAIAAVVRFDVQSAPAQVAPAGGDGTRDPQLHKLSEQELARFEEVWSRWDAFLGFIIKVAGRYSLTEVQQDILLDSLIDTRHLLVDALSEQRRGDLDPVRDYFIRTWNQLRPVFRSLSVNINGAEALRLLGFIAAVDALEAVDQLGPVSGWDVSVDGLRRLAGMLVDDPDVDPLEISPEIDPELRSMFDFGPPLVLPPAPANPADDELLLNWWMDWLTPPARAAWQPPLDKISPTRENIDEYLNRVRALLREVSTGTIEAHPMEHEFHMLFENLVYTTAWQETCWRQYLRRNGKLEVISSSVGALGLMQVMPKVWRGFYDEESLANSIRYNAAAGSEILRNYFVRYALRKEEHLQKGGLDNLVRATYAAYHGGPSQMSRYRRSNTSRTLRKIDNSFWAKFERVRRGEELEVKQCYAFG